MLRGSWDASGFCKIATPNVLLSVTSFVRILTLSLPMMRIPAPDGIFSRSPSVDVLGRLLASIRFVAMSTSLVSVRGLKGSTIARTPVLFPVTTLPRTSCLTE